MISREETRARGISRAGCMLAGALLLVSSGCAVGPDYQRPEVPLNADWIQVGDQRLATQTPVDTAWWQAFHDAALGRLIELAYRQNLPLQIAGLRILEARARLGLAVAQQFPRNVLPVASAALVGVSQPGDNGAGLNHFFGSSRIGFDALWEPDFWGKYRRGVRADKAALLATVADYDDALVSLSAEVARTYFVIRTFEVLIQLTRDNIQVQAEAQQIAESRFRHGATAELDVTQATNLLETTRALLPELQIGLQQAQNALCTLVGRPPGSLQSLLDGGTGIPAAPAQVAVGLPAEMLRRRPDIRSAELRAVAQCNRIGMAKADLFPSFHLLGAIGTQFNSGGVSSGALTSSLLGPGSLLLSLGSLFWPLLSYPKILNNVRVQDARFQQSLIDYQETVLRAAQEVEDGIAGFVRQQEAAVHAQNAVVSAQASVKLALTQYREGAVDYVRVLDAQRALLQSQTTLARVRSSVVTNLVALYKALGGGWEVRQGQPAVTDSARIEMQRRTNWGSYFSKPLEPAPPPAAPPPSR